jgi:hypothetical protein
MERFFALISLLSAALVVWVLASVRRQHIRVEYSVSWLVAGVALLVLSRWRSLLDWVARAAGLEDGPLALLLLSAFVFLAVFYRFSMLISDLKDSNIALTQRLAILEFHLQNRGDERQES